MLSKEEMGQFCSPLNLLWAVYKFMFYNMEGIIYKRKIIQIWLIKKVIVVIFVNIIRMDLVTFEEVCIIVLVCIITSW